MFVTHISVTDHGKLTFRASSGSLEDKTVLSPHQRNEGRPLEVLGPIGNNFDGPKFPVNLHQGL